MEEIEKKLTDAETMYNEDVDSANEVYLTTVENANKVLERSKAVAEDTAVKQVLGNLM